MCHFKKNMGWYIKWRFSLVFNWMLNGRYETNTKLPEILIGFVFFLQRVPPICLAEFGRFYWILLHKFYENFRGLSAQSFLTDTIPVSAINIFSFFPPSELILFFFSMSNWAFCKFIACHGNLGRVNKENQKYKI